MRVNVRVFRYKQDGAPPRFDSFSLDARPDEYVLDVVERLWAEHDRSLVFRHACHHAACGACGLRVNGRERLGCTTRIDSVAADGGTVTLEPLRNLPVISDLVVDMAPLYARLEQAGFAPVRAAETLADEESGRPAEADQSVWRFENCLECGLCLSACPIPALAPDYFGPAALAAVARMVQEPRLGADTPALLALADGEHGLWRCHAAFECVEACPTQADPGGLIMALRRQVIGGGVRRALGLRS